MALIQRFRHYEEDYLTHPIYRAIREVAWNRAKGRCERCGAPASEVHHRRYPQPWGSFDTPGNLQAVCHPCHCQIEGKSK